MKEPHTPVRRRHSQAQNVQVRVVERNRIVDLVGALVTKQRIEPLIGETRSLCDPPVGLLK